MAAISPIMRLLLETAIPVEVEDDHEGHDHDHDHEHDTDDTHDDDSSSKPWGEAVAVSFLVQLTTLTGLVLVVLIRWYYKFATSGNRNTNQRQRQEREAKLWKNLHQLIIPTFAAGALLATAIFIIIPESLALMDSYYNKGDNGHDAHRRRQLKLLMNEAEANGEITQRLLEDEAEEDPHINEDPGFIWIFGTGIFIGYLLPICMHALFPSVEATEDETSSPSYCCQECLERQRLLAASYDGQNAEIVDDKSNASTNPLGEAGACCKIDEAESGACDCSCHSDHEHKQNEEDSSPVVKSLPEAGALSDKKLDTISLGAENGPVETRDVEGSEMPSNQNETPKKPLNIPLILSLSVGDAFHNFTDGIFLGNALLLCSRSVAYTMVATTVYHELAQEVADFCLLTHHCGLSSLNALLVNFLVGFSTMIGALLVLAIDLSELGTGIVLSISAGVYIHIAASECIPRAQKHQRNSKDTLIFLASFICGAIPMGLILLSHGHCDGSKTDSGSHLVEG